jgi:hypothetical protein
MPAVSPITCRRAPLGCWKNDHLTNSTKVLDSSQTLTETSKAAATDQQPDHHHDEY